MTIRDEKRCVRIIVCRPGETAVIEEINDSLESMQRLVGGMIEE